MQFVPKCGKLPLATRSTVERSAHKNKQQNRKVHHTMNAINITTATATAAVLAIASNAGMPASERALIIKGMLEGRTFKAVYSKAKPELDENGNAIPREAICTTNYTELAEHSAAYKAWLAEQDWKASKGLTSKRKEAWEYGNICYWDLDKDAFRNFKVDNLISIELVD